MERQKSIEGLQLLLVAPFLFAPAAAMGSAVEDSENCPGNWPELHWQLRLLPAISKRKTGQIIGLS